MQDKKNSYAVPAVDGMLDIVEFLANHDQACGVTELARELGLSTNLVFRVMKRLVKRGYARTESGGSYRLGSGFYTLGLKLQRRFDLRRTALPFLKKLCLEIGETCQLQTPDGDRMLAMEVVTPESDYYLQVVPGSRTYYHANAFGKCVMAYMNAEEQQSIIAAGLPQLTPATITDAAKLGKELEKVRREGFGYDRGEYLSGVYCIGAPIFDDAGKAVAGIGITGLASRFDPGKTVNFKKAVKKCAKQISQAIGSQHKIKEFELK